MMIKDAESLVQAYGQKDQFMTDTIRTYSKCTLRGALCVCVVPGYHYSRLISNELEKKMLWVFFLAIMRITLDCGSYPISKLDFNILRYLYDAYGRVEFSYSPSKEVDCVIVRVSMSIFCDPYWLGRIVSCLGFLIVNNMYLTVKDRSQVDSNIRIVE